jgi:hypothetical protein
MKIKVEQRRIDRANQLREKDGCYFFAASKCPVANAIDDYLKPGIYSLVYRTKCYIGLKGEEIKLPEFVAEAITNWDKGTSYFPPDLEFDLDCPYPEYLKEETNT